MRPKRSWLRGIALNHCRSEWSCHQIQARLAGRLLAEKSAELELVWTGARPDDGEERLAGLRPCLQQLGPRERTMIEMRFVRELALATLGMEATEGLVRLVRRHDDAEVAVRAGQFAVVASNVPFVVTPYHASPHHLH